MVSKTEKRKSQNHNLVVAFMSAQKYLQTVVAKDQNVVAVMGRKGKSQGLIHHFMLHFNWLDSR